MGFVQSSKRKRVYPTGADHPRFKPDGREPKPCQECGAVMRFKDGMVITAYRKKKFCSKACADKGGLRYSGEEHPNYRPDARRKNRGGSHHKWVNAVISRDQATCQHCGAKEVELHAHHVKSYRDHPELRFDVDNGMTLCYVCHWAVHTALNENAVNSVNTRTGKAEGNTEPSSRGNPLEGVTTRGRAYRRWVGQCDWCKTTISKRWSDVGNKPHLFCSGSCRSKWQAANRTYRPMKRSTAVISSTSAARESEEIV